MSDMDDLSVWLRAQFVIRERQLDEDERVALAADGPRWKTLDDGDVYVPDTGGNGYLACGPWNTSLGDTGVHMARWDPQRVLDEVRAERRDIEAKKLILAWCDRLDPGDGLGGLMAPDAREIRKLLAVKFADESGFRAEWLPSQRPEQNLPQQGPGHVPTNELLEHPPQQ